MNTMNVKCIEMTGDEFHLLLATVRTYGLKYMILCLYKDNCLLKRKRINITRNPSMSERILVFSGNISRDLHNGNI